MVKCGAAVIVTGGYRGIGRAIVELYASQGWVVMIFDRQTIDETTIHDFKQRKIFYYAVDVTSADGVRQAFEWADTMIHDCNVELTALINNAGMTIDRLSARLTENDWDTVIDVNLKGAFLCTQHAVKRMIRCRAAQTRYVVMIGSIVGTTGNSGQVHYAASKAGLTGLAKSYAREYASRMITVNVVAPGFIDTEMTRAIADEYRQAVRDQIPLGRYGTVQDVAELVHFITSGRADYLTGQVIHLNGGMLM